jgi:hypothetical protein
MKGQAQPIPGPGTYNADSEFTIQSNVTTKLASRGGVFGSTGSRFKDGAARPAGRASSADSPGPGSYSIPEEERSKGGQGRATSTFASASVRMKPVRGATEPKYSEFESEDEILGAVCSEHQWRPVLHEWQATHQLAQCPVAGQGMPCACATPDCSCAGDPRNLGPGSYMLTSTWKANSKHGHYKAAPGFFTGASRLVSAVQTSPAPGAYEIKDLNKALKPVTQPIAPFGVTDARLPATWRATPGPGRYNLSPTWQKRSYNITLDDTILC